MIGLLTVRHILTIAFLGFVGVWRLALVPVITGIFLFLYTSADDYSTDFSLDTARSFFEKYALVIARCMMMFGIWGVVDIFGADPSRVGLWLVGVNILLLISSYMIGYQDGKRIFHLGYYIASLALFWHVSSFFDMTGLLELMMTRISFTMGIYAFIVFVVGALGIHIDRSMHYPLFVTGNMSIIFLIYHYTKSDLVVSVVMSQVYLMALYCVIWWVLRMSGNEYVQEYIESDDLLRRILSGEKNEKKSYVAFAIQEIDMFKEVAVFIHSLHPTTKGIISSFNIILIFLQLYFFIGQLGGSFSILTEVYFWFGVTVFFVNFLLLRQINWYHELQRIIAFVLVNFGIYMSIIDVFGQDPGYLVSIGIIRSIVNGLLVFQSGYFHRRGLLEPQDYLYWIGANLLATVCNVYFIFMLPLSLQIQFSFAFLYLSIQLFLTYYNLKYLTK